MPDTIRPDTPNPPVGGLTSDGETYLPPENHPGASPGGGLEDGTTSGTTGRTIPPGAEDPVDDRAVADRPADDSGTPS